MFQVIFSMKSGTDIDEIKAILPIGWTVEDSPMRDKYLIEKHTAKTVGIVEIRDTSILIIANEKVAEGKIFWQGFGFRYPELNPFDLRFGVLYLSEGSGSLWVLDEFPKRSHDEILSDISHYVNKNYPRYISFFYGDWHPQISIQVQTCKKINKNGSLGKNEGKLMFLLSSAENRSII